MDDGLARLVLQRRWSADRRGDERRKYTDDCHRQVSAPPPNNKSSLPNVQRKKEGTYQNLEAFSAKGTQIQSVTPRLYMKGEERIKQIVVYEVERHRNPDRPQCPKPPELLFLQERHG